MPAKVENVDHPVFAVRDLEVAHTAFRKLGFVVPPVGRHQEWGTGNICIMFARDYLEIRGIADPSRYLAGLEEFLADGEGLIGVAFGMLSADESYEAAKAAGLHVTEPRGLQRRLEAPGKILDLRFRNVMLQPEDHPGFSHANLCQHLTPDELRQPGWLDHPNTAFSVATVVGVVGDLDDARRRYAVLLGEHAVTREGGSVWLRFPVGSTVELVTADEATKRGIGQTKRSKDYMASMTINVRDVEAAKEVFGRNGVRFEVDGGVVAVDPAAACGAPLSFVEARDA